MPAVLSSSVDLYHPLHGGDTPLEVLVSTAIVVGFVLAIIIIASIRRPRGERVVGSADDERPA